MRRPGFNYPRLKRDESIMDRPDPPRCTCGLTTTECRIAGQDNHNARLAPDVGF